MAFTIPNQADAGTSSQSEVDAVDFGILVAAYNGTGVVTGGVVAQQSSADMTVQVAAGTVLINGLHYTISAGNGTISTADASNPRFDLITINTSGAVVVTAGTAASNPVFPAIPADDAVLAAVHVPAGDTAIATAQITDKRVIVMSPGVPDDVRLWLGTTGDTAMMHSASIIAADGEVANLIEGTSVHLATTANSLIVSNITDNGDILFLVSDGGNSKGLLHLDGTNGRVVVHAGDMLISGTQKLYFNDAGGEYISGDGSTLTITGTLALSAALPVTSGGTGATALTNLITLGTHTTGAYIATIADLGAGGIAVAGSGSETGAATVQLDVSGLTTDTIASGDFVAFSDEDEANDVTNKLTVDNLMETGLPLVTEDTVAVATDYMVFLDGGATGNTNKEAIADFVSAIAGANLTATSGVLAAAVGVSTGFIMAVA